MAENNLEQLWKEEGDEGSKEGKQQLGAIGSSASPPSTEEIGDTAVRLFLLNEIFLTAMTNIFM